MTIMIDGIKQETEKSMRKTIDSLHSTLSKIRAGRPNPSMLDSIEADYFDVKTPLKQLANITVTDASTLSLNIWDKNAIKPIEKSMKFNEIQKFSEAGTLAAEEAHRGACARAAAGRVQLRTEFREALP